MDGYFVALMWDILLSNIMVRVSCHDEQQHFTCHMEKRTEKRCMSAFLYRTHYVIIQISNFQMNCKQLMHLSRSQLWGSGT